MQVTLIKQSNIQVDHKNSQMSPQKPLKLTSGSSNPTDSVLNFLIGAVQNVSATYK